MQIYLVGGAIRDRELGLQVVDRDWVVVGATPEYMIEQGYEPVGKDFPVFINRESGEEYALARTERKTAKGYQGFKFNAAPSITLQDDLARRDITINAIAEDQKGQLIDPFGGLQDLKNGVIRHVSGAFIEDPVRVLRVARFAARFGFRVATETMEFMRAMVEDGEVDALVAERVWAEMEKALKTDAPQTFFQLLRDCGALAIVLPEIDNLFGIPQTAKYHPEIDSGVHTMMVLEQVTKISKDPLVRFAALVHDLGKAATPASSLPSHKGHEKRGLPIIKQFCQRLRVPRKYQSLASAVAQYHLHMHKMGELRPDTVLRVLENTRSINDDNRARQIADCCIADARGRAGFEDREYWQAELFLKFQQAAKSVDSEAIAALYTNGREIKAAIQQERIAAIKAVDKTPYLSRSSLA
ncbi:MAG: multifunctional CCA addition/repair protein [Arenicella sp.]|nr:multifunctional CCA addition/repair protein [Arenicella sp.]